MTRPARTRRAALLAVATLALLPGCYERTVSATGYGADRVDVYKANAPRDHATINGRRKIDHKPLD